MDNIKITFFATTVLTTAFNDKSKQITDILVDLCDENSPTANGKMLISVHF